MVAVFDKNSENIAHASRKIAPYLFLYYHPPPSSLVATSFFGNLFFELPIFLFSFSYGSVFTHPPPLLVSGTLKNVFFVASLTGSGFLVYDLDPQHRSIYAQN